LFQSGEFLGLTMHNNCAKNAVVGVLWTPIYPALLSPATSDPPSIFYWILLFSLD
jgi:hypothetical protein